MSKWEALDPHMPAGLPVWQAEMKRIDGLRFWSNLQGVTGRSSTASVFHFHPVGMVGTLSARIAAIRLTPRRRTSRMTGGRAV